MGKQNPEIRFFHILQQPCLAPALPVPCPCPTRAAYLRRLSVASVCGGCLWRLSVAFALLAYLRRLSLTFALLGCLCRLVPPSTAASSRRYMLKASENSNMTTKIMSATR